MKFPKYLGTLWCTEA